MFFSSSHITCLPAATYFLPASVLDDEVDVGKGREVGDELTVLGEWCGEQFLGEMQADDHHLCSRGPGGFDAVMQAKKPGYFGWPYSRGDNKAYARIDFVARAEYLGKKAEFDKAYAANEVAYHKAVDGALETLLIPSATNAELKSLLQTGLKIFQGHEQHAEHVAAALK
jgi:hypothetical protein